MKVNAKGLDKAIGKWIIVYGGKVKEGKGSRVAKLVAVDKAKRIMRFETPDGKELEADYDPEATNINVFETLEAAQKNIANYHRRES